MSEDWQCTEEPIRGGLHIGPSEENRVLRLALEELSRQHEQLRKLYREQGEALELYAEPANWSEETGDVYTTWGWDGGANPPWSTAREALEGANPE